MPALPYKLACICDIRDERGRALLLHRRKAPNMGLYSPIGGKLDVEAGESPTRCAQREIEEEAGVLVPTGAIHMLGLVSEQAYEGHGHWLMFVFRVLVPVSVPGMVNDALEMREGVLRWCDPREVGGLALPATDREVIWPLVRAHEPEALHDRARDLSLIKPGFFSVHIDCREVPSTPPGFTKSASGMHWRVEQSIPPAVMDGPQRRVW